MNLPKLTYAQAIEAAISFAALELGTATTPETRAKAWDRLQALHKLRPEETVREMDKQKGLA